MGEQWIPYVVRQGDYLVKIAQRAGFDADDVWKDPRNDEIRGLRKTHSVLAPGDIVRIPKAPKEGLPITKGSTNRYVATVPKVPVRLRFQDASGPLANARFVVEGAATPSEGSTDGDGHVRLLVSVLVPEIAIQFPDQGVTHRVRIGHLDPVEERAGAASRLAQLGYLKPVIGEGDDAGPTGYLQNEGRLAQAIQDFQAAQGLDPTGALDDATRAALKQAHGA